MILKFGMDIGSWRTRISLSRSVRQTYVFDGYKLTLPHHPSLLSCYLIISYNSALTGAEDDSNVCIKWGKGSGRDIFDGAWKFGKALGVIGSFTTIPAAVLNFFFFSGRVSLELFIPWIAIHVLNSFLNFMLLIGKSSLLCTSRDCKLARAGYVAIIGGFLWLLAAVLLCFIRRIESGLRMGANGVGRKDDDDEERLALPAPDYSDGERSEKEAPLALPAPPNKRKVPSREVPLALPPPETSASNIVASPQRKKKSTPKKNKPLSSSTSPKRSPVPSNGTTIKSPRNSSQISSPGSTQSQPSSPNKSPNKAATNTKKKRTKVTTDGAPTPKISNKKKKTKTKKKKPTEESA